MSEMIWVTTTGRDGRRGLETRWVVLPSPSDKRLGGAEHA